MVKTPMGMQSIGSQEEEDSKQNQAYKMPRVNSFINQTLEELQTRWGQKGKPLESNMCELLKRALINGSTQDAGDDLESLEKVNAVFQEFHRSKLTSEKGDTMTLEDFLIKAGVFNRHGPLYPPQARMPHPYPPLGITTGYNPPHVAADVAFPESPHPQPLPPPLVGTLSDTQAQLRKRAHLDEAIEKSVERRQKRMIKNRESAARSRARKQAYTNELENKVSKLEEENEKLRKWREMDNMLPSTLEPRFQLRRTSSAPF